jgi:hypothetical protein
VRGGVRDGREKGLAGRGREGGRDIKQNRRDRGGERGRKRYREGGREREDCLGVLDDQFRYAGRK